MCIFNDSKPRKEDDTDKETVDKCEFSTEHGHIVFLIVLVCQISCDGR